MGRASKPATDGKSAKVTVYGLSKDPGHADEVTVVKYVRKYMTKAGIIHVNANLKQYFRQ